MTQITPADDIIGPIVHQMAVIFSAQIVGIGRMYEEPPDGPPENNSVVFPMIKFQFANDTDGKEYIRLTFGIRYIVKRSNFSANILTCYKMFSALSRVLSNVSNQNLNNFAISVTPKDGGITQFVEAGQTYVALVLTTDVLTEYNVLWS